MFDVPVMKLNDSQKSIVYWCAFYRNILNKPEEEQPNSKYLNNDYALDRWLEMQKHKSEMQSKTKGIPASQSDQVFNVIG